MDYIKDAFSRMDLRQIRQYLLYGEDDYELEQQSYHDRLQNGSAPIYDRLNRIYPEEIALDKAAADLSQALIAYESVYMEIGMKAGARLLYQLLLSDDHYSNEKLTGQ